MLYSVKMRAAENGAHENGGRHISGAERLVDFDKITATTASMLARAFNHSRGRADFINIKVEAIQPKDIISVPLLPIATQTTTDYLSGRTAALSALVQAGVSRIAAELGLAQLLSLSDSMRGAMLICATTGQRLDCAADRGIRVSRMDIADEISFSRYLARQELTNIHVREALVLAAKALAAPEIKAELCWSDDPEYTTGYVASKNNYIRFPHIKPYGSPLGGRVFFVEPNSDIEKLISYLEEHPVLVTAPAEGDKQCNS